MIKVKILGTELEADLLNPAVTKAYETGFDKVIEEVKASSDCETGSKGIERQCNAVIEYIDNVFGDGSAKKVFGSSVNVLICFDALEEMVEMYENQVNQLIEEKVKRINEKLMTRKSDEL